MALLKPTEVTCTITLNAGEPIRFKVQANEDKIRNFGSRLEKLMSGEYIGLELDGGLTIIPISNIQTIQIDPAPPALIANVVKDATRL